MSALSICSILRAFVLFLYVSLVLKVSIFGFIFMGSVVVVCCTLLGLLM